MIQVTYDEYNQCYTKHDTLSSLLEEEKNKKEKWKSCRRVPHSYQFLSFEIC